MLLKILVHLSEFCGNAFQNYEVIERNLNLSKIQVQLCLIEELEVGIVHQSLFLLVEQCLPLQCSPTCGHGGLLLVGVFLGMLPPQQPDVLGQDLYHVSLVVVQIERRDHLPLVDMLQRNASLRQVLDVTEEWLEVQYVHLLRFQLVLIADSHAR